MCVMILRCVIPVVLSNNSNKLLVHMYIVKNTTIFLIVRLLLIRYLTNSKRTIRNIVVFLTIYICTSNLLLCVMIFSVSFVRNISHSGAN